MLYLRDVLNNSFLNDTNTVYWVDGEKQRGYWNGTYYMVLLTGDKVTVVIEVTVLDTTFPGNMIPNIANATSEEHPEGVEDNATVHLKFCHLVLNQTLDNQNLELYDIAIYTI